MFEIKSVFMYLILLLGISLFSWVGFLLRRNRKMNLKFFESSGFFISVFLFYLVLAIIGDEYQLCSEGLKNFAVMLAPILGILLPLMKYVEISSYLGTRVKINHYYVPIAVLVINLFSFIYMSKEVNDLLHQVVLTLMEFTFVVTVFFLLPFYFLLYLFLSIKKIRSADIGSSQRNWLRFNSIGLSFCALFFVLYQLVDGLLVLKWITGIFLAAYSLATGWIPIPSKDESEGLMSTQRDDTKERIHADFLRLMQEEKLYLDTKLSLRSLTKQLLSNEKYVSVYINETYGMSFTNYINQLRIQEAKALLTNKDFDHYTMESIANMAGFHSKSTFNLAFKKEVGVTPSTFKNESR